VLSSESRQAAYSELREVTTISGAHFTDLNTATTAVNDRKAVLDKPLADQIHGSAAVA
jgi:hypothetical protein